MALRKMAFIALVCSGDCGWRKGHGYRNAQPDSAGWANCTSKMFCDYRLRHIDRVNDVGLDLTGTL